MLNYMYYIGTVNKFPTKARCGDIYFCNGKHYVYDNAIWVQLDTDNKSERLDTDNKSERHPKICKQCGAPLSGNECKYCGTKYW